MLFCFATMNGDAFAGCLDFDVLERLLKRCWDWGERKRALKLTGEVPIEQGAIFLPEPSIWGTKNGNTSQFQQSLRFQSGI
jgi:hypothetical protein